MKFVFLTQDCKCFAKLIKYYYWFNYLINKKIICYCILLCDVTYGSFECIFLLLIRCQLMTDGVLFFIVNIFFICDFMFYNIL